MRVCKLCNKSIPHLFSYFNGKASIYLDDKGNKWSGKTCPSCIKIYQYNQRRIRGLKPIPLKQCKICNKEFKHHFRDYCSDVCKDNSLKNFTKKYTERVFKKREVICHTCGSIRIGVKKTKYCSKECIPKKPKPVREIRYCKKCSDIVPTGRSKFCSNRCGDRYKNKLHRKRLHHYRNKSLVRAKLKTISWGQIQKYYDDRPPGFEVDHIIPINHPNVCGLHVHWNFQYISRENNIVKSNTFDNTYENMSWVKLLKS